MDSECSLFLLSHESKFPSLRIEPRRQTYLNSKHLCTRRKSHYLHNKRQTNNTADRTLHFGGHKMGAWLPFILPSPARTPPDPTPSSPHHFLYNSSPRRPPVVCLRGIHNNTSSISAVLPPLPPYHHHHQQHHRLASSHHHYMSQYVTPFHHRE